MKTLQCTVIRHGETDWNREARMQGHADVPLNDLGKQQAAQVAQALQHEKFAAVYSSDLSRASATAEAICAVLSRQNLPEKLQKTEQLRERHYGEFQGKTLAEVEPINPQGAARWRARDPNYAPAGGEDLLSFATRIRSFFESLAQQHAGQHICVVTHGGVLDVLWRMAHDLPMDAPRNWPLPNTGINRLIFENGKWRVDAWGHTQHLSQSAVVRDETIA